MVSLPVDPSLITGGFDDWSFTLVIDDQFKQWKAQCTLTARGYLS